MRRSWSQVKALPGQVHLAHGADLAQAQLVCQADPVHHVPPVRQLHKKAELFACMLEGVLSLIH